MNLFKKSLETDESVPTIEPIKYIKPPIATLMPFKYKTNEDFLFERILYIREVLSNPQRYIDAPDGNALNTELFRLLVEYEDAIGKKINMKVEED